jgi:hypothetical protein
MQRKHAAILSALVLLALLVAVLSSHHRHVTQFGPLPHVERVAESLPDGQGNVALYVGTESFEPKEVDVCVRIDGRTIAHDVFRRELRKTHTRYWLKLTPGPHELVVESERGQARLEKTFDVAESLHLAVTFYYSSPALGAAETLPQFTFHAEETPWIPDWALHTAPTAD